MNQDDPRSALSALVNGAKQTQCLRAAVELGLAEHLAAGPATSAELAAACGAHEPALRRLLRALVAMDVLTMNDGQAYSLTPVGSGLRSDRIAAQRPSWRRGHCGWNVTRRTVGASAAAGARGAGFFREFFSQLGQRGDHYHLPRLT